MPDPNVIAEGLTDMDTWLTGTLTPAVAAVDSDLTAYQVSPQMVLGCVHRVSLATCQCAPLPAATAEAACCPGACAQAFSSPACCASYTQPALWLSM